MARKRCLSCGGEYDTVLPDAMRYFHACPPLRRVRVRRGAATIVVDLDRVLVTDERLEELAVERPERRDENVVVDPADRRVKPKAEGLGAEDA